MNIFAKENIGRNVSCLLEKDGVQTVDYVKWVHAMVGSVVNRKVKIMKEARRGTKSNNFVVEVSKGWKVLEVGV